MEIEDYYIILERLADDYSKSEVSSFEFLSTIEIALFERLVSFRQEFIDSKEINRISGLLETGYFDQYKDIERKTLLVICLEVEEIAFKKNLRKDYETYKSSQPLFLNAPKLLDFILNEDLIDRQVFVQINNSEVLKFDKGYTYLDKTLNPAIVAWTINTFPDKNIYLRANPYRFFKDEPPSFAFESILMPANPNWWHNLKIHNRSKEGASYLLENCSPTENREQYWEFNVKGINRLEVIAKRNNNGNLSMMIEEITQIDKRDLLYGRCIHLDTDAVFGTEFENSILNHLDFAINIYEGDKARQRLLDNLAAGVVTTDASFRTHLLRIEEIPFKSLFDFVMMFLVSKTLVKEWFSDQFDIKD